MKQHLNSLSIRYLGAGAAFLFNIQIARFLSGQAVGEISTILALTAIFQIVLTFGAQNLILRDYPRLDRTLRYDYMDLAEKRVTKFFVHIVIAWLLVSLMLKIEVVLVVSAAILLGYFLAKNSIISAALKCENRASLAIFLETGLRWVLPILIIQLMYFATLRNLNYITLMLIILSSVLGYFLLKRELLKTIEVTSSQQSKKSKIKSDKSIGIASIVLAINENLPVLLAVCFIGEVIAGHIRIAYVISTVIALSSTTINQLIAPTLSLAIHKGSHKNTSKDLNLLVTNIVLLTGIFFIFVAFSKSIIQYTFGANYIVAASYSIIFIAAQLISAILGPCAQHINIIGKSSFLVKVVFVAIIFQVITMSGGSNFFGEAEAIAYGYLISTAIWNIACVIYLRKHTDYSIPILEIFRSR